MKRQKMVDNMNYMIHIVNHIEVTSTTTIALTTQVAPPERSTAMSRSLHASDIAYHIHSQTNLANHEKVGPTVMVRGEGIYTWDDQGKSTWTPCLACGVPRWVIARRVWKKPHCGK